MYGISTSMYFLIIVIQLVGCGGSNPKTGVMVNGRSRRKRVGSQCSTVLSGEIALAEGFFWTKVILTGFQVGEEEQLQQLPRGDLFPYIQQVNKPTHPQQIITTNTNELSRVPTPP